VAAVQNLAYTLQRAGSAALQSGRDDGMAGTRRDRAGEFIRDASVGPDSVDMQTACDAFIAEMKRGLAGENSSLHMLPTYLSTDREIPVGEPVAVLDAGGTNFRVCTVEFDESFVPKITNYRKTAMPGARHEVSAQEFFAAMSEFAAPVIPTAKKIGFCFSYAAEITPQRDGRLLYFSKEIKAPEVHGRLIGSGFLHALPRSLASGIEGLTLLNDTAAALLAGKAASQGRPYSSYVGFILGTGTNTAYLEHSQAVKRIRGAEQEQRQIINVESGSFAYPGSAIDREFYSLTKDPGSYQFEKLISGAYLGPYAGLVVRKGIEQSLFSEGFARRFESAAALDTVMMDEFLHRPDDPRGVLAGCCAGDLEDAAVLYTILDAVVERAGKLTAVNIAAAVLQGGEGTNPARPVCITADGTTFYRTHNVKFYTEYYLHAFLSGPRQRWYELVFVDNAPVIGAAIAGLTH
jgi:hexokinase